VRRRNGRGPAVRLRIMQGGRRINGRQEQKHIRYGVMKITNLQARKVIPMAYPVAGSCSCAGYSGYGTAAFALVLFILLVIILRAGIGFY